MSGYIINSIGWITLIVGLKRYFSEKTVEENRIIIGKKWIWFILFFIIDIILYLTAGGLMVAFTGGV